MNWLVYNEGQMILTSEAATSLDKNQLSIKGVNTKEENLSNDFNLFKEEFLGLSKGK